MHKHTILTENGWPAHNRDMLRLLGVQGTKWPDAGLTPTRLHGVTVWVEPRNAQLPYGRRGMKHRLQCLCPDCGKQMSVARLQQHVCKQ